MTDTHDQKAVEERLWKDLKKRGGTGMLGLTGSGDHFQPMTAFVERETGQIWFFTRKDTDLAKEIGTASPAMFIFQDDNLQACIGGKLSIDHDRTRIDKYWNPVVAAWYPEGKDDPFLTLLRMDLSDAEVWISDDGMIKFAWEVAQANLAHKTPDMGDRAHLDFH